MTNLRKNVLALTLLSGTCLSPAGAQQTQPALVAAPLAAVSITGTPPIRQEVSELDGSPDVRQPTARLDGLQPGAISAMGRRWGRATSVAWWTAQGTVLFHSSKDDADGAMLHYFHPLNTLKTHIQGRQR